MNVYSSYSSFFADWRAIRPGFTQAAPRKKKIILEFLRLLNQSTWPSHCSTSIATLPNLTSRIQPRHLVFLRFFSDCVFVVVFPLVLPSSWWCFLWSCSLWWCNCGGWRFGILVVVCFVVFLCCVFLQKIVMVLLVLFVIRCFCSCHFHSIDRQKDQQSWCRFVLVIFCGDFCFVNIHIVLVGFDFQNKNVCSWHFIRKGKDCRSTAMYQVRRNPKKLQLWILRNICKRVPSISIINITRCFLLYLEATFWTFEAHYIVYCS